MGVSVALVRNSASGVASVAIPGPVAHSLRNLNLCLEAGPEFLQDEPKDHRNEIRDSEPLPSEEYVDIEKSRACYCYLLPAYLVTYLTQKVNLTLIDGRFVGWAVKVKHFSIRKLSRRGYNQRELLPAALTP